MAKQNTFEQNPGLFLVLTYFVLLIVNSLVILLANAIFPQHVVLSTIHVSFIWAICLSLSKLTLLDTFAIPFVRQYEIRSKRMLSNTEWMILYFILNFVGLWLISRFAHVLGLGLSSWIVAALLALVLDIAQGGVMMRLEKCRTK